MVAVRLPELDVIELRPVTDEQPGLYSIGRARKVLDYLVSLQVGDDGERLVVFAKAEDDGGDVYAVPVLADGRAPVCNCTAGQYSRLCKHRTAAERIVAGEVTRLSDEVDQARGGPLPHGAARVSHPAPDGERGIAVDPLPARRAGERPPDVPAGEGGGEVAPTEPTTTPGKPMNTTALATNGPPTTTLQTIEFSRDQIDLIKRTVMTPDVTDEELKLFLYTAKVRGLDPLLRQIYGIKRKGKLTIQVGIDGFRLIADRTERYAGNDEPVWHGDAGEKFAAPARASATVWKIVGQSRVSFTATARWEEYYPGEGGDGFMWRKMPFLMLAKCAEAQALRKAFPQQLGGLYVDEEMHQSDVEPRPQVAAKVETIGAATLQEMAQKLVELADLTGQPRAKVLAEFLALGRVEQLEQLPEEKSVAAMAWLDRRLAAAQPAAQPETFPDA